MNCLGVFDHFMESAFKGLIKAVRTAYIEGTDCRKQVHNFLFSYRNASHCTTKIPPATLMFHRETSFAIPTVPQALYYNIKQQARKRQQKKLIILKVTLTHLMPLVFFYTP